MAEKMLVTQALDERDLLVKKIGDKIQKILAVDTKKRNEEKTVTARVSPEEFGNTASAAYQQDHGSDRPLSAHRRCHCSV